jgi:O-methyltransferase
LRYIKTILSLLHSLPAIREFLGSAAIGGAYNIGYWRKLRLLVRFYLNTEHVETLSDFREHMELAAAVLRVPPETPGAVVECGCYLGGSTINLSLVCAMVGRKLIVFDSFAGLPEPKEYDHLHYSVHIGHTDVYFKGRFAATEETVRQNVARFGSSEACEFRPGYFEQTMRDVREPVVMAFLDVDLIDSLRPCLAGLWPNLEPGCRIYTHEALNLALISVFFDNAWWREVLHESAPGFVGSGVGLPLGIGRKVGSQLGYTQKSTASDIGTGEPDPEMLFRALTPAEQVVYHSLKGSVRD